MMSDVAIENRLAAVGPGSGQAAARLSLAGGSLNLIRPCAPDFLLLGRALCTAIIALHAPFPKSSLRFPVLGSASLFSFENARCVKTRGTEICQSLHEYRGF
jgi:hypothetical protein